MRLGFRLAVVGMTLAFSSAAFSHDPSDTSTNSSSTQQNSAAAPKVYDEILSISCGPDERGRTADVMITQSGYPVAVWLYHPGQPRVKLGEWTYDKIDNAVKLFSMRIPCHGN